MYYKVEMRDNKTGDVRLVPMPNAWSGENSIAMWRERMCDCNCHGFYDRKILRDQWGHELPEPHQIRATAFGHCEHGGKRSRYLPIKAILDDGREVALA